MCCLHDVPRDPLKRVCVPNLQCAGVLLFKSAGEYSYPVLLQQLLKSLEAHAGVGAQAAVSPASLISLT